MLDLNKTLYTLKKMIKSADTSTLDAQETSKFLSQIISYAKTNKNRNVEKLCWSIISKIGSRKPSCSMIHDLECIQRKLLNVKKKQQVMLRRQTVACYNYNRLMKDSNAKQHDLALYDIVNVPTQGGVHQSVIIKINEDQIECLPITSASPKQLRMIGRDFYPLGQTTSDGTPLYLTDSKTNVPYNLAARSYIRSSENADMINSAIKTFAL